MIGRGFSYALLRAVTGMEDAPLQTDGTARGKYICKVKFAVHALPEQEAGQTDLTACPNDQFGIR